MRRRIFLQLIFTVLVFLFVFAFLKSNQVKFIENFKIKKIFILYNNTTIPNDLLYKEIKNYLGDNIFKIRELVNKLKNKFPEIKQVNLKGIPFGAVKLEIISKTPMWYTYINNKLKFFCSQNGWFEVFDEKKINLDSIVNVEYEDYAQFVLKLKLLQKIYNKFKEIENIKVVKMYFKKNLECILTIVKKESRKQIVVDENICEVPVEILDKVVNICSLREENNVYARFLHEMKLFVE